MIPSDPSEAYKTVDHLFRQESGKMVSVLTRMFGFPNIEDAEDIVQDTLVKALEVWKWGTIPDNPQGWLYTTAKNKAIDVLRRKNLRYKIENDLAILFASEYSLVPKVNELFTEGEIKDSQLRMMFACCHPFIAPEAQITLVLKTLCGLSVKEIANAFLTSEETISKRLYRTKEKIREEKISLEYPGADAMPSRMEAVLKALYLLFNEGYSSSHAQTLIRKDLCDEAMRLTDMLTQNQKTNMPHVHALLALMYYHVARFDARLDDLGFIVLLEDQDRSQWNSSLVVKGNECLEHSAVGDTIHDLHLEAAIASLHANAPSFEETNWPVILSLYDSLYIRTNNPMVALNRCLVLGETEGPETAIIELKKMKGLGENSHYHAALGEMYLKSENKPGARLHFEKACALTTSGPEAALLKKKLELCT